MNNYEQKILKPGETDSEDVYKWEIDFTQQIDELYHEIQGETIKGGIWVPDPNKVRRVNERGASVIKQNMIARINKATALTRIDEKIINRMCANFGINTSELIFDNYDSWDVQPRNFSGYYDLCNLLVDKLELVLNMAKDGGLRLYRQGSRNHPQIPLQNGGGIF